LRREREEVKKLEIKKKL
jgi:hypothetical protein